MDERLEGIKTPEVPVDTTAAGATPDAELSIQRGPALGVVMDLARRPVRYPDLRSALPDRFGDAPWVAG